MIRKSLQTYNGFSISKVLSPDVTLKNVLRKIRKIKPSIFRKYIEIKKPTGIPQYFVLGTDYYSTFVNRIGRPGSTRSSNGKGYKKIHALVSGLMEMAERYSCNKHLIYRPGKTKVLPFKAIKKNLFGEKDFFSNPFFREKTDILPKNQWYDAKIMWLRGQTLSGKHTLLPASLIIYMHEITNGMASGNSIEEALLHGICEVIERHCKAYIRENKITPPIIDQETIRYQPVKDMLKKFKKTGQEITLMNYSMDIGVPVVAAIRRVDKKQCIVTVGVAPHPEEAIARALTENSQGDEYRKVSYFRHLFRKTNIIDAKSLPNIYDKDIRQELLEIERLLLKRNMKIWYIDMTDKVMGIPAIFVIVSNTRRNNVDLAHKNIIVGLTEESLKIKDYGQAIKYATLGERKDKSNSDVYGYFKGVAYGFGKEYKKSLGAFTGVKKTEKLHEMQTYLYLQLASIFYLMGDQAAAVKYMVKNIREYPKMRFVYLRPHHVFSDEKDFAKLCAVYEELKILNDSDLDIKTASFQKQFANKLD